MKAFVVEKYGKDGVRAADVPEPTVGDRDVLVRVSAASINPLDKMIRNGEFKQLIKHKPPFVLGHDLAGVVTRVGSAVRGLEVGDEVYARPRDLRIGGFAEFIAIDMDDVAPKPASLTLQEAAAVPLVALAAWQVLVDRAHVQPGQKVLIRMRRRWPRLYGHPARQAPRRHGSHDHEHRHGEAGQQPRRRHRRRLHEGRLLEDAVRLRPGAGLRRGANLEKSLTVLKPGGLAISVVGPPDAAFAKQLGAPSFLGLVMSVLSRKVRKKARALGVRYEFLFMQADGSQLRKLGTLYDSGKLHPVIDSTFPFDRTLEAMAYVEQGRTKAGKVVVSMVPDND